VTGPRLEVMDLHGSHARLNPP